MLLLVCCLLVHQCYSKIKFRIRFPPSLSPSLREKLVINLAQYIVFPAYSVTSRLLMSTAWMASGASTLQTNSGMTHTPETIRSQRSRLIKAPPGSTLPHHEWMCLVTTLIASVSTGYGTQGYVLNGRKTLECVESFAPTEYLYYCQWFLNFMIGLPCEKLCSWE